VNRSVVAIVALVAFLCPQRGVQAAEPESDTWGNPFCAGMVDVIPWDRAANSPAKVITSDRFFVQLVADGKTNVAATITLITSSEAYSVAIPRTDLLRERGTDTFFAEPILVAVDKPIDVRYAFVDSIGVDGAQPATCPTVVQSVEAFTADSANSNDAPAIGGDIAPVIAKYLQALPTLTCPKAYTPPDAPREGSGGLVGAYGNRPLSATIKVYIDSNGIPAGTSIARSSGLEGFDDAVLGAAQHTRYQPAKFLCTPVVSTMELTLTWSP